MAAPLDSSQPRLAAGCRWGGSDADRVILFPEGAIKLQGTGRQVLERCDGTRTFGEIIAELQKQFGDADPDKIRADIAIFLEQLQKKRVVDY
jgi:pyrroloquinoline quinone biosynthesis protein D